MGQKAPLQGQSRNREFAPGKGAGAALALAAALFFFVVPLSATPKDPRLQNIKTFAFALGDGMLSGDVAARFAGYDLVIVDGEEVEPAQVAALHAQGTIVLAYLSVGTIERGRWWFDSVRRFRLDYWGNWGEWYADTSRVGYRRVIIRKVAPWMLNKGVDGLFLDNTDMIGNHRRQRDGMYTLIRRLSSLVHGQGKFLFAQNGRQFIGPVISCYDGWNREDVSWSYDFDTDTYYPRPAEDVAVALADIQSMSAAGLLVTAVDYVEAGDAAAEGVCLANACSVGAIPFISDIWLTRMPAAPPLCGTEVPRPPQVARPSR